MDAYLIHVIKQNQTELSIISWNLAHYLLYQKEEYLHSLIQSELFTLAMKTIQDPINFHTSKSVILFLTYFVSRADLYCVRIHYFFLFGIDEYSC